MQELFTKLRSLVRDYPGPALKIHVIENLGQPIPPNSKYFALFMQFRAEISLELVRANWNPQRQWGPGRPVNRFGDLVQMARQQREAELRQVEAMQKAMLEAEYKAFMLKQWEAMAKQAEMIDRLLRELSQEESVVIANKLRDPDAMTRWLAVQVGGKKRMPIEHDLIRLLADPHPLVRQAAHQALYRLSRGTDFGPDAKATAKQIATSQGAWRNWLAIQTDARIATSSAPKKE